LLIAAEFDLVPGEGAQKQIRGVHDEVRVDRFPFGNLCGNALKSVLTAVRINSGEQRRTASEKRAEQR
jgi:hypothetical protein